MTMHMGTGVANFENEQETIRFSNIVTRNTNINSYSLQRRGLTSRRTPTFFDNYINSYRVSDVVGIPPIGEELVWPERGGSGICTSSSGSSDEGVVAAVAPSRGRRKSLRKKRSYAENRMREEADRRRESHRRRQRDESHDFSQARRKYGGGSYESFGASGGIGDESNEEDFGER